MLKALSTLLEKLDNSDNTTVLSAEDLNLAKAALLVEVAIIDQDFDQQERSQLKQLLLEQCQLSEADADALIEDALQASSTSASLYDFTQEINRHCDYQQKLLLVRGLWSVAYADNNLDKYEEHIIRRIADLIHVSHRDFIMEKISVRDKKEGGN